MASEEPVEKLSEVLSSLKELNTDEGPVARRSLNRQIDLLLEVQEQMQQQLSQHDAQIRALREVIALLSGAKA